MDMCERMLMLPYSCYGVWYLHLVVLVADGYLFEGVDM